MGSERRAICPHRLNKVLNSKFPVGYPEEQTPNEGLREKLPKRYDSSNKNDGRSLHVNKKKNMNINMLIVGYW